MTNEKFDTTGISYSANGQIDSLNAEELRRLHDYNESELKILEGLIKGKNEDKSSYYQSRSEIMAYQSKIRLRLSSITPKKTEVSYDSQSILSSSSVTKKDSKLLIEIPEDYFLIKEKKS